MTTKIGEKRKSQTVRNLYDDLFIPHTHDIKTFEITVERMKHKLNFNKLNFLIDNRHEPKLDLI